MFQMFAAGAAVLMITLVQTPPQRPGAAAERQADLPVVLSGCLVATAEPGAERKEGFMLINAGPAPAGPDELATRDPETGTTGVGTTGTGTSGSGSSASPTTAQDTAQVSVLLTAGPAVELRQHVNRRVEVQGTMSGGPLPTISKGTKGTAEAKADEEPRQVRVTKVRRLSGACSGKK